MNKIDQLKSSSYLDLVKELPLAPITCEMEEVAAEDLISILCEIEEKYQVLTEGQDKYLATLNILLEEYRSKNKKSLIPDIYGVDLLKILIKENRLRQKDLVSIFKTESILSEILHSKKGRKLTVEHIEKLAEYFKIPVATFFPR